MQPVAKAEMLIRKPVAEVFEAFVDPSITTKFWFTKSSGKLEAGKKIKWDWEMYNYSTEVNVKIIEHNKRIVIEWPGSDKVSLVEWIFTEHGNNATFVSISNSGFSDDSDTAVNEAIASTEGFTIVLAGLKALLEHNISL